MPAHDKYNGLPPLVRFSNVSKVRTSAGALKAIAHAAGTGRGQVSYADGDKLFMEFYLDGTETLLEITTVKLTDRAIWDLYVNGTQDSTAYDDYNATSADSHREITITPGLLKPGRNTLELRVNGKNASSTNYGVRVVGASLQ